MKTLLILLLACSTARANLIDLTPGGFDTNKAPPDTVQQILDASRKLGQRFGVSKTTILNVRNRETWRFV